MQKLLKAWVMLCLLAAPFSQLRSQTMPTRETTIKAVFLFNFSHFVEWPSNAFASPNASFVIGVLGDDPFGGYLDETVEGEKVNGHPLVIQRYRDVKEIRHCHILFVNNRDPEQTRELLALLRGRNILTVSDARNFTKQGGMIRFFTESNKIRLEINPETAKSEELVISSKLLRIATVVD